MNDLLQQELCELVNIHGEFLTNEPQKCQNLLNDYSKQHPGDVFVLVSAVKEGVAAQLLNLSKNIPQEVLLGKLSKTLQDNLFLTDKAAQWAVESWAIALGIINKGEWLATSIKNSSQLKLEKTVQQKLCQIIKSYGKSICDESQRCEALLFDYCAQYRQEITLLVNALKEGVAKELLISSYSHKQLAKRLENNLYLNWRAAEWAVKSWAIALGVEKNLQIQPPVIWPRKHSNGSSFSSQPNVPVINKWLLGFAICWAMGIGGYTAYSIILPPPPDPEPTPSKSPSISTSPKPTNPPPDPNCYVKIKESANIRSKPASFLDNVIKTSTGEEQKVTGKYTPGGWIQVLLENDQEAWAYLTVLDKTKNEIFDCMDNKNIPKRKVADIPLPKISQKEAKDLILKWLKEKSKIFAPPFDIQTLNQLATDSVLSASKKSIDKLKKNNGYIEYDDHKINGIEQFNSYNGKATIQVSLIEAREHYSNGKLEFRKTMSPVKVIYKLKFVNRGWRIAGYDFFFNQAIPKTNKAILNPQKRFREIECPAKTRINLLGETEKHKFAVCVNRENLISTYYVGYNKDTEEKITAIPRNGEDGFWNDDNTSITKDGGYKKYQYIPPRDDLDDYTDAQIRVNIYEENGESEQKFYPITSLYKYP